MNPQSRHHVVNCLLGVAALASSGCMAGRTLQHSRPDYNRAVHYTDKQEMLLNLVRLKYHEPPNFLAITNLTHRMDYSGAGGMDFDPFGITGWHVGGSVNEAPTLAFTPLDTAEFNKRLVTPIDRNVVDLLGATGWSPGQLLRLTIKSINDVDNASSAGGPTPKTAPEFREFKIAMQILDDLHDRRQVEFTHVSGSDAKNGRNARDPDEKSKAARGSGDKDAKKRAERPNRSNRTEQPNDDDVPDLSLLNALYQHSSAGDIRSAQGSSPFQRHMLLTSGVTQDQAETEAPDELMDDSEDWDEPLSWIDQITPILRELTNSDREKFENGTATPMERTRLFEKLTDQLYEHPWIDEEQLDALDDEYDYYYEVENAEEKDEIIRALLSKFADYLDLDSEPVVRNLFSQIREGLKPPKDGSDEIVLRFATELLPQSAEAENLREGFTLLPPISAEPPTSVASGESTELRTFRNIFRLLPVDDSYPFFAFKRADYGQLRRRSEQIKDMRRKEPILNSESRLWSSPRSFLEILYFLSHAIHVPREHYDRGLVGVTRNYDGTCFNWSEVTGDLLCVCVSDCEPCDASTAVEYNGYWYYIRDNDLRSKSTFSLLMQLYNMAVRSGAVGQVPALTIPI